MRSGKKKFARECVFPAFPLNYAKSFKCDAPHTQLEGDGRRGS